jgi:glycosyltransferase involved in cell wall biosynthesis
MHILMIAPEPFFEPRGTPFSEFHRIRALTDLGHTVDLVTYPFGRDVTMPGLRIFRCLRPPYLTHAKIGPSLAKIPLDTLLTVTAVRLALTRRYDAVHSHEEGAFIGLGLAALLRIPHLYDMHSSLPQQLTNFAFSRSTLLRRLFAAGERLLIRGSRVIIVICPHLAETVREVDPHARMVLIENAPGPTDPPVDPEAVSRLRGELGLTPATPVILYTGTLEAYQGLDLLLESMVPVRQARPDARLVLAGGKPDQVEALRAAARARGVEEVVIFAGQRPAGEIPALLETAAVLVSPRSRGTNTPLKIYQYLRSGRPIVATRLLTHLQVLDDEVAVLTKPTAEDFARGILAVLQGDPQVGGVGERARRLAETKYTYEAYLERTREACRSLVPPIPGELAKDPA